MRYQEILIEATLKFCGKVEISASVNIIQIENKNVQNALNVKGFFTIERWTWVFLVAVQGWMRAQL